MVGIYRSRRRFLREEGELGQFVSRMSLRMSYQEGIRTVIFHRRNLKMEQGQKTP